MKRRAMGILTVLALALMLSACKGGDRMNREYRQITQSEAKSMMDENEAIIVLDVREQDEFDAGHIPGAVLLSVGQIDGQSAAEVIPQKDSTVLVYCRSGNRSKTASAGLAALGYSQVYEFGGINTWPYDIVK